MKSREKWKEFEVIPHPVQKWEQNDLQFVLNIMVIHLKVVLGIREIPTYL
jgi:hypothetical protein